MTRGPDGWAVEKVRVSAEAVQSFDPPGAANRTVRVLEIERAMIVLGSAQPESDLDLDAVAREGIAVARRRSGGGAVLLVPGEHVWIDFWIPVGDRLWHHDIVRAATWAGRAWAGAARTLGLTAVTVHGGPVVTTPWSARVCFAGRGPGEVLAGDRKLVGLSQRRTREWSRLSTMAHRRWDAAATFGLLAGEPETIAAAGHEWQSRVAEIDGDVAAAVLAELPS